MIDKREPFPLARMLSDIEHDNDNDCESESEHEHEALLQMRLRASERREE
jgi:hypothetical protein